MLKSSLTNRNCPDEHLRRSDLCGGIGNKKLRFGRIRKYLAILVLQPALEVSQITGLRYHFFFQWYGFDELVSDIHQEIHGDWICYKSNPAGGGRSRRQVLDYDRTSTTLSFSGKSVFHPFHLRKIPPIPLG